MNLTLGEVLYKIVDGICVETRALLTTPDTVPKSSIDHFLARAEILIAAFEQAAQIGAKPGYGIRDLSSETQSQHVMAKVYLDRLRKISA